MSSYGANAESTRLTAIEDCVQREFLLKNPPNPVVCPLALDRQTYTTVTTRLESTRLLAKVVECPLTIRESTAGFCSDSGSGSGSGLGLGYNVRTQQYSNITGIQQITQPVVGVSSGTYIARRSADIGSGSTTNNKFTPVFFRTFNSNTTSSGGPLYVCRVPKTAQDAGVPVARNVICRPGGRVVG